MVTSTHFGIAGINKSFTASGRGYTLRVATDKRDPRPVSLLDFGAHQTLYFVTNAHSFGGCVVEGRSPYVGEHPIERIELLRDPFASSLRERIDEGSPPSAVFYNLRQGSIDELNDVIDILTSSHAASIPVIVYGPDLGERRAKIREYHALDLFTDVSPKALQRKYLALQDQWLRHSFSLRSCVRSELALLFALQERDGYTALHSQSVALLAFLIGERMGMRPLELELLKVGATLHDLGKLGTLDSILNKPGRLTDSEMALIRQHPARGAAIISPMVEDLGPGMRSPLMQMVRYHHRRFDGGGYPDLEDGLTSLSPLAYIIAMADAFDAMTTRRVYVEGEFTLAEKIEDVQGNSGRQFHPAAVQALLGILADGFSVETQIELPSSDSVN